MKDTRKDDLIRAGVDRHLQIFIESATVALLQQGFSIKTVFHMVWVMMWQNYFQIHYPAGLFDLMAKK